MPAAKDCATANRQQLALCITSLLAQCAAVQAWPASQPLPLGAGGQKRPNQGSLHAAMLQSKAVSIRLVLTGCTSHKLLRQGSEHTQPRERCFTASEVRCCCACRLHEMFPHATLLISHCRWYFTCKSVTLDAAGMHPHSCHGGCTSTQFAHLSANSAEGQARTGMEKKQTVHTLEHATVGSQQTGHSVQPAVCSDDTLPVKLGFVSQPRQLVSTGACKGCITGAVCFLTV